MDGLSHPSPNFGARRGGAKPDLIVLHYTAMASARAALERLCDPAAEVSAHYLIAEDGALCRLVPEAARAWHAGAGAWGGVTDVNSRSIGIELANTGSAPFPEPQMAALERLLAGVMGRWAIPPERVIGHSDMAPGRKSDPGPRFDWRRLALQGLSVWPDVAPGLADEPGFWNAETIGRFAKALRGFGYAVPEGDKIALAHRHAFSTRFSGFVGGASVLAAAEDLARRFPVDRAPPTA